MTLPEPNFIDRDVNTITREWILNPNIGTKYCNVDVYTASNGSGWLKAMFNSETGSTRYGTYYSILNDNQIWIKTNSTSAFAVSGGSGASESDNFFVIAKRSF